MSSSARLILHIGTEKTGTTSIQEFLSLNRATLASRKIYTPSFTASSNHVEISLCVYRDFWKDELSTLWNLPDEPEARHQVQSDWIERLRSEVNDSGPDSLWIISSESLQSRIVHFVDIQRLSAILHQIFDDITILLYIREPISLALSLWSTGVKCGNYMPKLPTPTDDYFYNACHHLSTYQRWGKAFGSKPVVRIYENESFYCSDLLRDFCHACGLQWDSQYTLPPRSNTRLSSKSLACINYINQALPLYSSTTSINPIRGDLTSFLEGLCPEGSGYRPSYAEVQLYRQTFDASNEELRRLLFSDRATLFLTTHNPCHLQEVSALDATLSSDEINLLDVIVSIWSDRTARINNLRERLEAKPSGDLPPQNSAANSGSQAAYNYVPDSHRLIAAFRLLLRIPSYLFRYLLIISSFTSLQKILRISSSR